MFDINTIKAITSFFFRTGMRSRRTRLFFGFSFFPALTFIIIHIVAMLKADSSFNMPNLFIQVACVFYFQLFVQILALFYGAAVLSEEVEDRTLIFLTTSPVSKASIVIGKFIANIAISAIIITSGLVISFLLSNYSMLLQIDHWGQLFRFIGVALLSILGYSALFALLGALIKKAVIVGILFIFGWESLVQFAPGSIQKLTLNHYIKSLLPQTFSGSQSFLSLQLAPSSWYEAITMLLIISIASIAFTIVVFYNKEYTFTDSE